MFSDLLSSEKIAYHAIIEYTPTTNPMLSFDHVESKLNAVLDEFKVWFRFNNDEYIMRVREGHWCNVLNYFRAHRYEAAIAEASNIVGA